MTAGPAGTAAMPTDEVRGELRSTYAAAWGRTRRWIVGLCAIAIGGLLLLIGIDWHLYLTSGIDVLDNTISAEAAAIATALAVIGGLVAASTFFKAEPPPP